jgi:putative membrane protein
MHPMIRTTLIAGLALTLSNAAFAQKPRYRQPSREASKTTSADTEFAQKAAIGGKHEVEGAKFAAGKASSAAVKALANKLVKDHTAANTQLMSLMRKKQITAAAAETPAPEPWRSESGAAFDRAYIDHVIAEHEKDIALFETESTNGGDAELKTWAGQKLPTLREHLKTAQDLKTKLQTTTNR